MLGLALALLISAALPVAAQMGRGTVRGATNFRANRPNSTGQSAYLDTRTIDRWFDTSVFMNQANFTLGNVGRTIPDVRTPGMVNLDLSLTKDFSLWEGTRLQFRAESFNFASHVNPGFPNVTFSAGPDGKNASSAFGTIRSARSPRNVQLALKLIF